MTALNAVRLAVGTLTVLPVGPIEQLDRAVARNAMLLAPVAVLPVAATAAAAGLTGRLVGWPSLIDGLVVVAVLTLGTRAVHLDGLADTVDGLGSGWDTERALTVMRRSDVGPMGVIALVLALVAQAAAIGELLTGWRGAVLVAALICCSRAALVLVCQHGVPAARTDGLGAGVAGTVPRWAAALTWLLVAVALAALAPWREQAAWRGPLQAMVALLAVRLLVLRCVGRFGGVTGDVMGAAVEVAFTALVLVAVVK